MDINTTQKAGGLLNVALMGLAGACAIVHGLSGEYLPAGGELAAYTGFGYSAIQTSQGNLPTKSYLLAGGGVGFSGLMQILSGAEKHSIPVMIAGGLETTWGVVFLVTGLVNMASERAEKYTSQHTHNLHKLVRVSGPPVTLTAPKEEYPNDSTRW